jgi:hypothetical protein
MLSNMESENKISAMLNSFLGLNGGEIFHQILATKGVEYVCEYFIPTQYSCFI